MLDLTNRDRCFVIAEAGTAHLGRFRTACDLVTAAADAGADAIKFQWFTPNVSKNTMFCWMDGDDERVERWRQSALFSLVDWRKVKFHAESLGLVFLASAFEHETVAWLNELGLEATKVASRAAKTFPYHEAPAPFLVSTGMLKPGQLIHFRPRPNRVLDVRDRQWMQCEASYPSSMPWDGKHTGFSDHSGKPYQGIDAISRGCKLLEVHFKVDGIDAGPDKPACLTVDELKLICQARDYYAERRAA